MNHAKVEGAIVEVCERCTRFGTKVDVPQIYAPIKKPIIFSEPDELNLELVPEYGKIIIKARKDKGLSRYDFAQNIKEKESVMKRIEDEIMKPDEDLIKRMENLLNIKLTEKYDGFVPQRGKKRIDLTVGDIVEVS